ncbi:MAG TPA: PAS domain S-box protein [Gemmataceae bacterium]|nr:PAS domain S-box protein [Gemmataceae bacterium]
MVRPLKTGWQLVSAIVVLAAIYVGAGYLGLRLAKVHSSVTAVWPPTGISLAALLIFGWRACPGIFLGAFVVNLLNFMHIEGTLTEGTAAATALGVALGNTLEALLGAWLVTRFANGVHAFDRPQDVFKFTLLAAILSTMVSATWGVACLALADPVQWSKYSSMWFTWWMGDAAGALLVAPPLILWAANFEIHWTRTELVRAALLLLALVGICKLIFGNVLGPGGTTIPLGFLCMPVLVLVAFQFGARETASAMLLLSGLALWGTLNHHGPFFIGEIHESLLLLHAFLAVSAVTALALAAVVIQHRRAKTELQTANENLEQRVQERTFLLAQVNDALRKKIAQRNQAEKTLMENEERTRQIVETAYDPFIAINADGLIIDWNAQAEATFGWRRHEVLEQSLAERIIPPRFREAHRAGIARYLTKGDSHIINKRVELSALHRDGHEFPVEIRIWPSGVGPSLQFNAFVHDITERKRVEKMFRGLLESAPDAMVIVNQRGEIVLVNSQTESMFGYVRQEILGQAVETLMPESFRSDHCRYRAQYFARPGVRPMGAGRKLFGLHKDGRRFPVEVSLSPLQTDEGILVSGAIRDISEREETEAKLRQSERLAAIGEMVAGLAHESRNALQLSQACLELLECKLDDQPELQGLVRDVQKSQDHLHRLYEEVRGYAAPMILKRETCQLNDVLQDTWEQLTLLRQDRVAHLQQRMEGLDLVCKVDRLALGQVFRNILENSLNACQDPVQIKANWSEVHRNGHHEVRVSLSDNGPGMSPETQQRLFEPFFTTRTQGTGLGMAIAKRIVEAHDGQIAVAGEIGAGTEILITLPRNHS